MCQPVLTVRADDTVEQVASAMLRERARCAAVVDHEAALVGVIREEDFGVRDRSLPFSTEQAPQLFGEWTGLDRLELDYGAARSRLASTIMGPKTAVIAEDAGLAEAVPSLQHGDSLVVVRDARPVGTLSRHDLLKLVCRS